MRAQRAIGNIVKLAVLCGCVYLALNWQSITSPESDIERSAKSACICAGLLR